MIDFRELVKAGVHFGHRRSVWCPRMEPYIWGHKNDVHLIDISKTAVQLERAAQVLEALAAAGKSVLWVGTKKAAHDVIRSAAERMDMPYVDHRWIGGTLSNYSQVKKSVTKLLHYEDVLSKEAGDTFYKKKELNRFKKAVDRLRKNIGGIVKIKWPLGAIVLVDVNKEASALREAAATKVPVIALVDTNGDPSLVDYVIPGNDDAPRSVSLIISYLEEATMRGKQTAKLKKAEGASGEFDQDDGDTANTTPGSTGGGEEEEERGGVARPKGPRTGGRRGGAPAGGVFQRTRPKV